MSGSAEDARQTGANETWREALGHSKSALKYVVHNAAAAVIGAVVLAIAAGVLAWVGTLEWRIAIIVVLVLACATLVVLWLSDFFRYRPLLRWTEITEITDLVKFEKVNKESPFMPAKILARQSIKHLWVMGNGCSKWTRAIAQRDARDQIIAIRQAGGNVLFLACCPCKLWESDVRTDKRKAIKNAKSLVQLRELQKESSEAGGTFEIKTYDHKATLRLIVVDEAECIVGHYKEDGRGDSIETPLLVFRSGKNDWGFGHAFVRLFDHEWKRAKKLTKEYWVKVETLSKESVPLGTDEEE